MACGPRMKEKRGLVPDVVPYPSDGCRRKGLVGTRNNPARIAARVAPECRAIAPTTLRQPETSHCTFVRPDGRALTVPARRPIKAVYIRAFVKFIDEIANGKS